MITKLIQRFLAAASRRAIRREHPTIVAITGSVGKSSVKEAIGVALGAHESGSDVRMSLKNYNNEYGVPFTVLNVKAAGRDPLAWSRILVRALWLGWGWGNIGAKTLVLEMGSDRKGDLAWLTGIAPPDIAVVTAIAPAHAEFFGTIEDVATEKATLVRALGKKGLAVLNIDDARVTAMRRDIAGDAVYVGEAEGSDVRVHDARIASETDERGHVLPRGLEVALETNGQVYRTELRGTIGRPQAWAAAAAVAVAQRLRIPVDTALSRLHRDYHGIPGRTRIIPGIKYTILIDDSYNAASPTAVLSGLRDVATIEVSKGTQRRIAAIGDMRELGDYSAEAHRIVGAEVATLGFDALICCGTLARAIGDAAIAAGMPEQAVTRFDGSEPAGRFLQDLIRPGDIVFVKGSQGSRMEKVVKELMAEPLQAPFLLVRMTSDWVAKR